MLDHLDPEIIPNKRPPSKDEGGSSLDSVKNKFRRPDLSWSVGQGFQGGPQRKNHRKILLWSWTATMIDALFLLSLSCFFLLAFSKIVQSPAGEVLNLLLQNQSLYIFGLQVYGMVSWFYLVFLRAFFGFSIGEWACELRLGNTSEVGQGKYILKVILRTSLIFASGIITLPVLSYIFGKDLAGQITGLKLSALR